MAKQTSIRLFMWGFQSSFRSLVKGYTKNLMEDLGVRDPAVDCLLVGARRPDSENPHPVCIEPEDGKWPVSLFGKLAETIDSELRSHPLKNMFYTDQRTMAEKPENMRLSSVTRAVQRLLKEYDSAHRVRSFAGRAALISGYDVVTVLQLPKVVFENYPPVRLPAGYEKAATEASLLHATIAAVLSEAHAELLRSDPGRYFGTRLRSHEELLRQAASWFMHRCGFAAQGELDFSPDLLERFNAVSSLNYEKAEGTGRLILAPPASETVEMLFEFKEPVPFREPQWARKVLQMGSRTMAVVATSNEILGLGRLSRGHDQTDRQDVLEIEFLGRHYWQVSCGGEILLIVKDGTPSLPQEEVPRERLVDTFHRLFPEAKEQDSARFVALLEAAASDDHGSLLVVAEDAKEEAERLSNQATRIEPVTLTPELYAQASRIDGAILVDYAGKCHALGAILDGAASPGCTPSRGSRYNSAVRYVMAAEHSRLALVVSDDGMVDVIPILRPKILRTMREKLITELEGSTADDYHRAIGWLDKHRFYMGETQCQRINAALERIEKEPIEVGRLRILWDRFSPHPDLDESYFED